MVVVKVVVDDGREDVASAADPVHHGRHRQTDAGGGGIARGG